MGKHTKQTHKVPQFFKLIRYCRNKRRPNLCQSCAPKGKLMKNVFIGTLDQLLPKAICSGCNQLKLEIASIPQIFLQIGEFDLTNVINITGTVTDIESNTTTTDSNSDDSCYSPLSNSDVSLQEDNISQLNYDMTPEIPNEADNQNEILTPENNYHQFQDETNAIDNQNEILTPENNYHQFQDETNAIDNQNEFQGNFDAPLQENNVSQLHETNTSQYDIMDYCQNVSLNITDFYNNVGREISDQQTETSEEIPILRADLLDINDLNFLDEQQT